MAHSIILFVFVALTGFLGEVSSTPSAAKPYACKFFTYISAEKLLGGKTVGLDIQETRADGGRQWNCTFRAASGEGTIYFGLHKDATPEAASAEFERVRASNRANLGFEEWSGVGDEAVTHTDGRTFQFVMARKGERTIRIKINPINGSTLDDVKTVARLLVDKL